MTPNTDMQSLIDLAYRGAKNIIERDPTGKVEATPMAFMMTQDSLGLYPMPWRDDADKDDYLRIFREVLKQKTEIQSYAIASEAWVVSLAADAEDLSVPPSQHPDRVECLNIVARERGGDGFLVTAKITRREDGRRTVAAYEITDLLQTQGRMANLFDPPEAVH